MVLHAHSHFIQGLTGQVWPLHTGGCKSVLLLKEWGGSSAWSLTAPLNSVGPVIKWLDEWAISVCQLLAWPGELGRCQWVSEGPRRTNKNTHTHKHSVGRHSDLNREWLLDFYSISGFNLNWHRKQQRWLVLSSHYQHEGPGYDSRVGPRAFLCGHVLPMFFL